MYFWIWLNFVLGMSNAVIYNGWLDNYQGFQGGNVWSLIASIGSVFAMTFCFVVKMKIKSLEPKRKTRIDWHNITDY